MNSTSSHPPAAPLPAAPTPATAVPTSPLPLKALGLRPAMALQLVFPQTGETLREVQFLAAIDGKGVMVGPYAMTSGGIAGLPVGAECTVRGFTGRYDFAFPSRVQQTFVEPFAYALLTYPDGVQARQVRQALRIQTSLPASVSLPGGTATIAVTVVDLSPAGALVRAPTSVGAVGDEIYLSFSAQVDTLQVDLALLATICHSNRSVQEPEAVNIGLLFHDVAPRDLLALRCLSTLPA